MGTHTSNIWELNRTMKASMPTMSNFSHLGNASYSNQVNQSTALTIIPATSSDNICPRCRDKPDPNC